MRILLVADAPPDPLLGSTKVAVKLQEEYAALGHRCDLFLSDAIGAFPRNGHVRQALAPAVTWAAVRRHASINGPYDVLDVASAEALWLGVRRPAALAGAALIARSNGLEHLNYQRMLDDHSAGLLNKPWSRRLYYPAVRLSQVAAAARAADRLLLLNEADRAFALARGWKPAPHIVVVPHGVSARFLSHAPDASAPRGRGILFCGTWTETKGVAYLAGAFNRMVASGARTPLTILGGGVPEAVIRGAFSSDAQPFVTVTARAAEAEVMDAYRSHDVLAWPSTYEGFGMVLIEAMSQGLAVAATPVGCATSLVTNGVSGLSVPVRDVEGLADALGRLLNSRDLRERCAAAAFARVRHMTWTATARQTLALYEQALAEHRDGAGCWAA